MTETLNTGLELMAVGMGIVFIFLVSLILVANTMSALVQHFYPETEIVPVKTAAVKSASEQSVVAAITAAVQQHRSEK